MITTLGATVFQRLGDELWLLVPALGFALLASALIGLTERRKLEPGSRTIAITQQEISEMVGMTRESINKQLRAWAARSWVRLENGAIVVLDVGSLRELVEAGSGEDA